MADFDAGIVLSNISGGLTKFAESVEVIGEPILAGEKTIIPAVVAKVGFGAGGGSGKEGEGEEQSSGAGGGGGGGATLTPVFLIIDPEGERLMTVPDTWDTAAHTASRIKDAISGLFAKKKESEKEEE